MKTVDLIPFILHELNSEDKYGLELIKAIETISGGAIIVKQPTLYTILKKLEKSKFISSYWQDSEIGGKRHYYKLTEYGKIQVSMLPPVEQLVSDLLKAEAEGSGSTENEVIDVSNNTIEPKESILPSADLFAENNSLNTLDTATETEINIGNTEILKEGPASSESNFAENSSVSKFTEKTLPVVHPKSPINETNDIFPELETKVTFYSTSNEIKYVDYKNIKTDEQYIKSKKIAKCFLLKSLITSFILITLLVLCSILSRFSGGSALFYITCICSLIVAIFYPIITAVKLDKIKEKVISNKFNFKNKKLLFTNLIFILLIVVALLFINIGMGNNSFAEIFTFGNFENLYAPLLLASTCLIDLLQSRILFKKHKI